MRGGIQTDDGETILTKKLLEESHNVRSIQHIGCGTSLAKAGTLINWNLQRLTIERHQTINQSKLMRKAK
jgi:hypothetical protein